MSGTPPTAPRVPGWAVAVLLLILVANVWWRCHTIGPTLLARFGFAPYPVVVGEAEPLDCDEAAYAYIGKGVAHGKVMYRDLSENKPPLGYWLYALAVKVGGANELTIRLMPIPFVSATIALVWWIGLRLQGGFAACLAAFLFGLLSTDPYLYGNGANMEHFIDLFAGGSLAAMVRAFDRRLDRRWLLVAGAMVAFASLVKQVAAVHGPVYALALLAIDRGSDLGPGRRWAAKAKDLAALAAGFAIPWAATVAILGAQGAGPDAWEDIVRYGSALATLKAPTAHEPPKLLQWFTGKADPNGRLPWPFQWAFGRTDYLVWWGTGSWPVWLASVPALAWMVARSGPSRRLTAAWTLSSWVQVALPGLFWQHYYLLPTPGIALAVAVALGAIFGSIASEARSRRPGRLILGVVGAVALIAATGETVRIQARVYLMVPSQELTSRYKGGGQWIWLRGFGRDLARRSSAWEGPAPTLYIWGWQSPLFLYSELDGVTRHFFADPLLEDYARGYHRNHPRVQPRVDRIMDDLAGQPPSIVLVAYPPFPELLRFLERGYRRATVAGLNATSPDGIGPLDRSGAPRGVRGRRASGLSPPGRRSAPPGRRSLGTARGAGP